MNYIKTGFMLAIGWYLGKTVCKITREVSSDLVKHYVPDKYWNRYSPDYLLRTPPPENEVKFKIGFSMD